jgi:hypothetical protein
MAQMQNIIDFPQAPSSKTSAPDGSRNQRLQRKEK